MGTFPLLYINSVLQEEGWEKKNVPELLAIPESAPSLDLFIAEKVLAEHSKIWSKLLRLYDGYMIGFAFALTSCITSLVCSFYIISSSCVP